MSAPLDPRFRVERPEQVDPFAALDQLRQRSADSPANVIDKTRRDIAVRQAEPLVRAQLGDDEAMAALEALNQRESRVQLNDSDLEGLGLISEILLTLGVGSAAGGLPLAVRAALQGGVVGGFGALERKASGQGVGGALTGASPEAAIAAGAETFSGPVGRAAGATLRLVGRARRQVVGEVRRAVSASRLHIPRRGPGRAPFRPFIPNVEEAEAAVQVADEFGLVIPPAYLVENNVVDIAQNIANAAVIGGQRTRSIFQAGERAGSDAILSTAGRMGKLSTRQAMGAVQRLVDGQIAEVKGVAQGFYRQVDDMVAGATVDIRPLQREVRAVLEKQGQGILRPDARLRRILSLSGDVPFTQAQQIRSDLFEISKQFDIVQGATAPRNRAAATKLAGTLTRSINDSASRVSPEARALLNRANSIWRREVKGELTDELVKKIARGQPEDLLDVVIGSPGHIRLARKLVTRADPSGQAWQGVQGSFLQRVIRESSDPVITRAGGVGGLRRINGEKFLQILEDFGGDDSAALNALFGRTLGEGNLNATRRYANFLRAIQSRPGGTSAGSIFFNMLQAGAVGSVVFALTQDPAEALSLGAGAIVLGPAAVNRLMTNPTLAKWMSVGAASTPGSRAAARAGLVVLGNLVQDRLLDPENLEKARSLVRGFQEQLGVQPGAGLDLRMTDREQARVESGSIRTRDDLINAIRRRSP